jgi:lysozyme
MRQTSEAGVQFTATNEGTVLRTYLDCAGVPTKGIGHTNAAGPPYIKIGDTPWTREEAIQVFRNDLMKYEAAVELELPEVRQNVFDAAVDFHYNTGAIHKASWVPSYLAGLPDWRDKLRLYNKAGSPKKVVAGLVKRRQAEVDMIDKGSAAPVNRVLAEGSRGEEVANLQADLISLAYYKGEVDGVFGAETARAVRDFQARHPHLSVDGRVGPATRDQISRAKALLTAGGASGGLVAGSGVGALAGIPPSVAILILVIAAALIGYAVYRYRPEIQQRLNKWRGTYVS